MANGSETAPRSVQFSFGEREVREPTLEGLAAALELLEPSQIAGVLDVIEDLRGDATRLSRAQYTALVPVLAQVPRLAARIVADMTRCEAGEAMNATLSDLFTLVKAAQEQKLLERIAEQVGNVVALAMGIAGRPGIGSPSAGG